MNPDAQILFAEGIALHNDALALQEESALGILAEHPHAEEEKAVRGLLEQISHAA